MKNFFDAPDAKIDPSCNYHFSNNAFSIAKKRIQFSEVSFLKFPVDQRVLALASKILQESSSFCKG